jgi:hypothetical protein
MNAGLGIKVFTDEMITPRLAADLQRRGYDVLSCRDAGRANRNISDDDQLTFATSEGRAIYTFNYSDFAALDALWHARGQSHAGIIVSVDLNSEQATMASRLQRHIDTVDPAMQRDRVMILWPPP